MSIRHVVFDLGGVVFVYRPDVRLRAFAEDTGLAPDEIQRRLFRSGFSDACDHGQHRGTATCDEGIRLLGTRMSAARFRQLWLLAFEPDRKVCALASRLHNVGVTKPDPRIFSFMLSLLDARPHDVLYVDDSAVYVSAAQAFGFRAALFDGATRLETCLAEAGLLR